MVRTVAVTVLAMAALCGCGSLPPEQQLVSDAAAALGGRDRLLAIKTLVLEGGGTNTDLGQDMTPEATGQTFTVTAYRRLISFTANAMRTEQTRTPNFAFFQGQAAQRQVTGVDGDIGYNVAPNGSPLACPTRSRVTAASSSTIIRWRWFARPSSPGRK